MALHHGAAGVAGAARPATIPSGPGRPGCRPGLGRSGRLFGLGLSELGLSELVGSELGRGEA